MMRRWFKSVVNALSPPLLLTSRVTLLYIVSPRTQGDFRTARVYADKRLPSFRLKSARKYG